MSDDAKSSTRLAKAREYKRKHRAAILEWQKSYNAARLADPLRRAKKLEQDRISRKRNYAKRKAYDENREPLKQRARSIIRNRIYRGSMTRQPCEVCGAPLSHAHHDDYSKPLDVRWLCPQHHKEVHRV